MLARASLLLPALKLAATVAVVVAVTIAGPVAAVAPARATPYDSFLDVETEQDLYDALSVHQIDGETFERLRDLLARGVDLDVASRQELYELPNLSTADVDAILAYRGAHPLGDGRALVTAGVLDELDYQAIAPFLLVKGGGASFGLGDVSGWAQAQLRAAPQDRGAPPLGLRLRAFGLGRWSAGVALAVTRLRLDEVHYDPGRQALVAEAPAPRLALPKLYLRREDGRSALLLGSYRAGFGQRLVFDDTGAEQPAGFVFDDQLLMSGGLTKACKLAASEGRSPCGAEPRYTTPDLRWRDGLFGAALSLKQLALGEHRVALHAWASYAERSVYQYELVDRARCADPRRDEDAACQAPSVVQPDDGARHAYQTLPSLFGELLAGVHASYGAGRRDHLGVTGYLARTHDLIAGIELGAQETARLPIGQRFGAVGAEAALGLGNFDLSAELARSFDQLPRAPGLSNGGGFGAVVRLAWTSVRADEPEWESGSESESESESATKVCCVARPGSCPPKKEESAVPPAEDNPVEPRLFQAAVTAHYRLQEARQRLSCSERPVAQRCGYRARRTHAVEVASCGHSHPLALWSPSPRSRSPGARRA